MDALLQDLRYALRTLGRSRGFTAAAVLCLALGIGVNTAAFSSVNAVLLRPFPFENPEQLVAIHSHEPWEGANTGDVSWADLHDLRARTASFQDVAGLAGAGFALAGGDEPERIRAERVTPNLFPMLGVRPALGRGFLPEEGRPGGERVVILSHALWERRFGSQSSVIGRRVLLDGEPYTVVGVMPPGFKFPNVREAWLPLVPRPDETRADRSIWTLARLKPGVSVDQADREVAAVARQLATEHPETNRAWGARVASLRDELVDDTLQAMLLLMWAAVGFVLLIACANVANLLLARGAARRRELAVRAALGASRGRIVRQLLTESVLVALAGGTLGLLVAVWWLEWTRSTIPEELPYWIRFDLDARVLAFTAALSVLTGVVFGTAPALRAARTDLQQTLKEGGRAGETRRQGRLRGALVAGEIALALVLLVSAALSARGFLATVRADAGFDTRPLLTLRTYLASDRYDSRAARAAFHARAVERVEALPGVSRAVMTTAIPAADQGERIRLMAEGRADSLRVSLAASTPGLFAVLGTPLLAGRDFTPAEAADTLAASAIVGRALAHHLWPGQNPLGRRVRVVSDEAAGPAAWLTVVGVAPDVRYGQASDRAPELRWRVHVPAARMSGRTMALLARAGGDPAALAGAVRREVRALDPALPLYDVRTMDQVRSFLAWPFRLFGEMFGSFAVMALLLAAVGVYGVMTYAVSQRTHEIGVRMALGARAGDVLRMVLRQGAALALIGIALGLVGALGVGRLLAGLLYGVSATDAVSFGGTALVLAAVALLASWIPARRAARVDPVVALRSE